MQYFIEMLNHEMVNFKDNYINYTTKETMPSMLRLRQNISAIKNILDDIYRTTGFELTNRKQMKRAEDYCKLRLRRKYPANYSNPYIRQKKKQDHAWMLQCKERKRLREEREKLKNLEQGESNETVLQPPME